MGPQRYGICGVAAVKGPLVQSWEQTLICADLGQLTEPLKRGNYRIQILFPRTRWRIRNVAYPLEYLYNSGDDTQIWAGHWLMLAPVRRSDDYAFISQPLPLPTFQYLFFAPKVLRFFSFFGQSLELAPSTVCWFRFGYRFWIRLRLLCLTFGHWLGGNLALSLTPSQKTIYFAFYFGVFPLLRTLRIRPVGWLNLCEQADYTHVTLAQNCCKVAISRRTLSSMKR